MRDVEGLVKEHQAEGRWMAKMRCGATVWKDFFLHTQIKLYFWIVELGDQKWFQIWTLAWRIMESEVVHRTGSRSELLIPNTQWFVNLNFSWRHNTWYLTWPPVCSRRLRQSHNSPKSVRFITKEIYIVPTYNASLSLRKYFMCNCVKHKTLHMRFLWSWNEWWGGLYSFFCNRSTELNVSICVVKFQVLQRVTSANVNSLEISAYTQRDLIHVTATYRPRFPEKISSRISPILNVCFSWRIM